MAQDSRYLGSAKVIAVCTLISRVTGLARDIIINRAFGQSWVQDAFNFGFQVPNLFRRLFGEGALAAAFVPIFTETLDQKGKPAAWELLGRVTALLAAALSIITTLLVVVVLAIRFGVPTSRERLLQLDLTAIMLPFMISICLLALFSSILNCLRHFTVPALMPIVLNAMNILGVLVVGPMLGKAPQTQVYGVAITVLIASVVQLFIILPVLRRHGVQLRLEFNTSDENVRRMLRMLAPIIVGQGVLLLNTFSDSFICTFLTRVQSDPSRGHLFHTSIALPLTGGALSAITNAQRLYQFPLGVLAISLATAAFPLFSLYGSRKDYAGLRATLSQAMRVAIFEGLPSGVMLIVLAKPMMTLLFQYGKFDEAASQRAAWVLIWYGMGMPAFCCQHILLRGFYSLKDTLTPMWIGCSLVLLNILISITLVWNERVHEAAFGISTTITAYLHVMISMVLLRRRMKGRIAGRAIIGSVLRSLVAGAAAGVAAYYIHHGLTQITLPTHIRLIQRLILVMVPLAGAAAIYLAIAAMVLREEMNWLFRRQPPPA